jgi:dTDP-4-amino-4,6-dideoxygalactose transaminase
MSQLALLGGTPVRTRLFPRYNTIGAEEKEAVREVMESGVLSQFLGTSHAHFLGGPRVRALEEAWAGAIGAKHAVTVNSNTSGLIAAIGAAGLGPGDEVIVSPYTMTASALAPLIYGAVPVFADVEGDYFCLDPAAIEAALTPRTRAILVVHLFGQAAAMDKIMALARKRNLIVIEDCAQAPDGMLKDRHVGVLGDMGVFSLNYHKHIHTGEGGIITTNDDRFAERLQLIRNHGEAVVEGRGVTELKNTFGFNFRMTEIEAAIGVEQLKKLPGLIDQRLENVAYLEGRIGRLPGLRPAPVREGARHVYYVHPYLFDEETVGVSRAQFVRALQAELPRAMGREEEGPLISGGYVRPLYLQPLYQQRAHACGFNCPRYEGVVSYEKGLCPVAERLHFHELLTHELMRPGMERGDLDDVARAFHKVYEHRNELLENGDSKKS